MRDRVYGSILAVESAKRNLEMFGATCSGKNQILDRTADLHICGSVHWWFGLIPPMLSLFTDVGIRLLTWIRGGNGHDMRDGAL